MTHLGHDELSVLRAVQSQLLGNVSEGDAGVGQADHAHARFDHVVSQTQDQGVGVLRLELLAKLGQGLVKFGQVPCPHRCGQTGWCNYCRLHLAVSHKSC